MPRQKITKLYVTASGLALRGKCELIRAQIKGGGTAGTAEIQDSLTDVATSSIGFVGASTATGFAEANFGINENNGYAGYEIQNGIYVADLPTGATIVLHLK